MKVRFYIPFLTMLCPLAHSTSQLPDVPVTVIYNPIITVTPDRYNENFPDRLPVRLLINEQGRVERVIYAENTPQKYKELIDPNMKLAKFTPYLRQGVALKSVVPFTVRFTIQSEYDYNGELGE
ncbi:hypothetical protein HCY52_08340 [Acinetobacter radioresistens]|uniref:hypothetical protein n=1 Tax=Acinetobacter radioresistens TaxID=40216 RepID=UPI002006735A|nr:hypothetical protein [Acinetobacter radioresistens]MCK4083824.1 hypothetical protein [Acinetobacter radioresistens]